MLAIVAATPAMAQAPDEAALLAEQKAALDKLAFMDGVWRGEATTLTPSGEQRVTQTERIGPFLDGTLKYIEGRGFRADGTVGFHAAAVISYNPQSKAYEFRSHAQGRAGTFELRPTANGYVWEIPAGPATIRYTATVEGDAWREVGDRIVDGQPPARFFEMNLKRIGDTDWPAAGGVPPK